MCRRQGCFGWVASVVVALVYLQSATAQDFQVEEALPAPGSTDVADTARIAFAFPDAVSVETDWNTRFTPAGGSLRISRVALCVAFEGACDDGTETNRFVRFDVTHAPNTDYLWFVQGVPSRAGGVQAAPYVLHYTTADTIGERQVSGSLAAEAAKRDEPLTHSTRTTLRRLTHLIEANGFGTPVYRLDRAAAAGKAPAARLAQAADGPAHVRILLLDAFDTREDAWTIRGGTARAAGETSFTIPYVRSGTYWPLVVRYTDASSTVIDALGFYDPDGDGTPDAITVDEADRSDIALTLYPFPLTTATAGLAMAQEAAQAEAADAELLVIEAGDGARPEGTAYVWRYQFLSAAADRLLMVTVDPLGTDVVEALLSPQVRTMTPIAGAIVDSDAALDIALEDGGAAFIAPYPAQNLITTIQGGDFYWIEEAKAPGPFWRVRILALTSTATRTFERYIDLENGTVLTSTEAPALSSNATLAAAYPNPFHEATRLRLQMDTPGRVRAVVYDVLGRAVTMLVDRWYGAGGHDVTWDGRDASGRPVAAGLYVVRAELEAEVVTQLVMRVE